MIIKTRATLHCIVLSLTKLGVLLVLLFSLTAYLGSYHYLLDMFSHFRAQYFVLSIIFLVLLVFFASYRWLVLATITLVLNSVELAPLYFETSEPSNKVVSSKDADLRLVFSNVLTSNKQHSILLKLIDQKKPDLVIIQEADSDWVYSMRALHLSYSYKVELPRADNFGMAIYSRIPLSNITVLNNLGSENLPVIYFNININGQKLSVISTHPLPPINQQYFESRNNQLKQVGEFINSIAGHKMIVGDLNTTMWSPVYKDLIDKTGLTNARRGFGITPTWPKAIPLLKIPIDHVLVSLDIGISEFEIGQNIGSDHLPIIVDLTFNEPVLRPIVK